MGTWLKAAKWFAWQIPRGEAEGGDVPMSS